MSNQTKDVEMIQQPKAVPAANLAFARRFCRWCERAVAVNPSSGKLRSHQWSIEQHNRIWPAFPFLDGYCPGSGEDGPG